MRAAFPPSDYYGSSAPPQGHRRTTRQPATPAWMTGEDGNLGVVPMFTTEPIDGGGAQLCPCDLATVTPQAFTVASRPATQYRPESSPPRGRVRAAIQPLSTGFELADHRLRGVMPLVPRVHLPVSLAGPAPSGSSGASRRCRGCLPPSPASPGSGCPQLPHAAATTSGQRSLTSARFHGASWRSASAAHSAIAAIDRAPVKTAAAAMARIATKGWRRPQARLGSWIVAR
jgi:hypothetical protein